MLVCVQSDKNSLFAIPGATNSDKLLKAYPPRMHHVTNTVYSTLGINKAQ